MELGWQDIAALLIVVVATVYLANLVWSAVTRKQNSGCGSGCGKCSGKSSAGQVPTGPVVSIGLPERHAR
jgi:attachment p12 family protein